MASPSSFTNDEIKHRIVNVYPQFVSDVDSDRLSDYLLQGNVITTDQWQRIRLENPAKPDRCRALLNHLFSTQHPKAFLVVRQALCKENHYLRESIDNQEQGCGIRVQPEEQTVLQGLCNKVEDLEQRVLQLEAELHSETTETKVKAEENSQSSELRAAQLEIRNLQAKTQELENYWKLNAQKKNLAGSVHQLEPESLSGNLRMDYKSAIITKILKRGRKINGLAILDKELFVVREENSEVDVFDSILFNLSRQWSLKELILPKDMGSCSKNKCLYIFDFKEHRKPKEILRVDPNGKLINNWSTGDDWGEGLSVTDESNIILAVFEKNKLNEYSPDGQLIREINLSSDAGICEPWHAIKLANGHFVVSNGLNSDRHRVCMVDAAGRLQKSFHGEYGSIIDLMYQPVHLSVDGNGFVMVADKGYSRVLLLTSDLTFDREILSKEKHELRHPTRILLDESNGKIIVADNSSSLINMNSDAQILIFDI